MKTFQNLIVWQKAHRLVIRTYEIATHFPRREMFGLTAQTQRCAVSIAANIAEGSKRRSEKDFCHFLNISQSSLEELKYYLILARDLNYLSIENYQKMFDLSEEVGRLLSGFYQRVKINN